MAQTTAAHHESPGLGPKKTLFVMITVVGCIAVLWPKVFYPMWFGAPNLPPKNLATKAAGGAGEYGVTCGRESIWEVDETP